MNMIAADTPFRKVDRHHELLSSFPVNSHFYIGIFKGTLSEFDIIVKYKQKIDTDTKSKKIRWTRGRAPKHSHLAADLLVKYYLNKDETKGLVDILLNKWNSIKGFSSIKERDSIICESFIKNEINKINKQFPGLVSLPEYSLDFLIALIILLMYQEKTNNKNAIMFEKLLKAFQKGPTIWETISTSSMGKRK